LGPDPPNKALVLVQKGLYLEALIDVLHEIDPAIRVDLQDPALVQAPEVLSDAAPQLVLFDVDKSPDAGPAYFQPLRARFPDARFIAVGTAEEAATIEGFLAAGAAGYVPKSFVRSATLAVLRLALNSPARAPLDLESTRESRAPSPVDHEGRGAPPRGLGLTERETEVLALAAEGKTNAAIAEALGTAPGTVRIQMSSILSKLDVSNRSEAIIVAFRMDRVVWEQIRKAEAGHLDLGWLLPHMEHRAHRAKHVLFRKNDIATELYFLQHGRVVLPELGVEMRNKDVFGEIGIFASSRRRTSSAICATDVDLFVLSEEKAKRMYYLNPAFALFIVNLVSQRLAAHR